MIINANRKELLAQARRAAKVIQSRTSLTILGCILLEADEHAGTLRLTATDMETAIRVTLPVSVERGGAAAVEAKLLAGILEKLAGEEVYMDLRQECLFIRSESAEFSVVIYPAADFPKLDIPIPGDTVTVTGLKSLITGCVFAAMDEKQITRPSMGCVCLTLSNDGLTAAATNGNVLVVVEGDRESVGNCTLLVPASALKTLAALARDTDVFELGITGPGQNGKRAVFYDGTLLFSARLMEGDFLDTDSVLSSFKPAAHAIVNADKLRETLGHVASVVAKQSLIELSLTTQGLVLRCEGSHSDASAVVETHVADPIDKKLYLTPRYLANCVKPLRGEVTLAFSAFGHLMLQTKGAQCLLIGQRKRESQEKQPEKKAA